MSYRFEVLLKPFIALNCLPMLNTVSRQAAGDALSVADMVTDARRS